MGFKDRFVVPVIREHQYVWSRGHRKVFFTLSLWDYSYSLRALWSKIRWTLLPHVDSQGFMWGPIRISWGGYWHETDE